LQGFRNGKYEVLVATDIAARGIDVDGITGFYFTSLLNLEARGVKPADIVALRYPDFGVELYGNAIIASPKLLAENQSFRMHEELGTGPGFHYLWDRKDGDEPPPKP